MTAKAGLKSSETYGAAAIVAGVLAIASQAESDAVVITCIIVAGAVGLGYAALRTKAKALPILLAASLLLAGCSTPSATNRIGPDGPVGQGGPVSMATMNSEGLQVGSYQGAPPTNIKQDAEGAWLTTPGQGGATVINLPNGISAYIWSPLDGKVGSIKVTGSTEPGQFSLDIIGMEFNISDHAKVLAGMYADAMDAIKDMTRAEAERRLEEMRIAGSITSDVAKALLNAFVPTLPAQ